MDDNIIVICGGLSDEREVSLRSGRNVHAALKRLAYHNAVLFDFQDLSSLEYLIEQKKQKKIDKAILVTHGAFGEDGCIQGFLELLQIPYTGSNVETSAVCMNKIRTKEVLSAHKLPVLHTYSAREVFEKENLIESDCEIICKLSTGGSSVGIVKFSSVTEFKSFVKLDKDFYSKIDNYFIEKFIRGTEVTTSIIQANPNLISKNQEYCQIFSRQNSNLVSLPILELKPKNDFYDYEAKYTKGMTEFTLPAKISKELEKQIHSHALEAFYQLKCKTAARVDFIIDKNTNSPYILEVNTLPGMTDTSDLPAQAESAGIGYDQLVELILTSV